MVLVTSPYICTMAKRILLVIILLLLPIGAAAQGRYDWSAIEILGTLYFFIIFPIVTAILYLYPLVKKINRRDNNIILYRLFFNLFSVCLLFKPFFDNWTPGPSFEQNITTALRDWEWDTKSIAWLFTYFKIVLLLDLFVFILRKVVKRVG